MKYKTDHSNHTRGKGLIMDRIYSIVDGKISSTSVVKETAKRFYVDGNKTTSFYDHYKAIPKNDACLTVEAAIQRRIEILRTERKAMARQVERAKEEIKDMDNEIERWDNE